jgi:hypothetical protein
LPLDADAALTQTGAMRGAYLVALAALCVSGRAAAEEEPICADRPGKTTGTCTVPVGHWQLETGLADWSVQKEDGARATSLAFGETTIKYGLTDNSNLEIDITPWQKASVKVAGERASMSGFGDMSVLYKQRLTGSGSGVQVAAMPFVKLPTANHSLGNGKWEGGFLLPVGFSIGASPFSIGLTPELDWAADADGHGHHPAMAQVVSVGWAVAPRLSLAADVWGQWNWDPAGTVRQASLDGSLAYLVSKSVQLDAGANFGLNQATPDVELYAGVSKRF